MPATSRVVLITGAHGDIGRGLARVFGESGAALALCDLAPATAVEPWLAELAGQGAATFYRQVDVTREADVAGFVTETVRRFGRLDLCLANAGIVERGGLLDLPVAAWQRTLDVNLTGCFVTAQAAARAMVTAGRGGHILFTGSWTQDQPRDGIGAYCASKSGLKMLAKCLALELGSHGVRVNVVAPGWVDAGLTARNLASNPQLRGELENQVPLARLMPADEFARAVRMFCSEDASYVTGTTFLVDGGASLIRRK